MGRFIIKLDDWYLEWSTVVDAPVTYGMTRDEFTAYYRDQYGRQGMEGGDFAQRMERVETKGTSSLLDKSVDETLAGNRAGKDETRITREQIVQSYCIDRKERSIVGVNPFEDDERRFGV
jgi:hypothetical protein